MNDRKKKIDPIVLKIDKEQLTADQYLKAVQSFVGILRNVADNLTETRGAVTWYLSAEKGSQVLSATAEADDQVVPNIETIPLTITQGLRMIERRGGRPKGFDDTALRHAKELSAILGPEEAFSKKISVAFSKTKSTFSPKTEINVSDLLGTKRIEDGTVEGRIAVISDKKKLSPFIYDILTGHEVRCTARNVSEDELISAFRRRVVLVGSVHYRSDNKPVSIDVDSVRLLHRREDAPTFEDMKGIFKRSEEN